MNEIDYTVEGRITPSHDCALIDTNENPHEEFVQAVIQTVAIDIEVTSGGVTLHLAAWVDPEHWIDEWHEKGIEDPRAFIAGLVHERVA